MSAGKDDVLNAVAREAEAVAVAQKGLAKAIRKARKYASLREIAKAAGVTHETVRTISKR